MRNIFGMYSVPGVMAWMSPAPVMPPRTCENVRRTPRSGVIAPTRTIPRDLVVSLDHDTVENDPHSRVKETAGDAEEDPSIDSEGEAKSKSDVQTVNQRLVDQLDYRDLQTRSVHHSSGGAVLPGGSISRHVVVGDQGHTAFSYGVLG